MSSEERQQAGLSAAVLASCHWLYWPTPVLLLTLAITGSGQVWLPICTAAGLLQAWFGWRLQLDAGLLRKLENGTTGGQVDLALARLFARDIAAGRTLEARQRGIARLLRRFLMMTVLVWSFGLVALSNGVM